MSQLQMMIALLRFYQRIFKHLPTRQEEGFSVLEAMIAMAILSVALIPLLTLQAQFVRSVETFERAQIRMEVRDSVLTYIEKLNLSLTPSGNMDLGAANMEWTASLAGLPQMSRGDNGVDGRFEMALYNVNIQIEYNNGQEDKFIVRGIGWRPVVAFSPE